jgi:hypothetical protein
VLRSLDRRPQDRAGDHATERRSRRSVRRSLQAMQLAESGGTGIMRVERS